MISDNQFALNIDLMLEDTKEEIFLEACEEHWREKGLPEADISSRKSRHAAKARRRRLLMENGVKVTSRKYLTRVSNVRFHNGMMQDGTCHYEQQVTVSGNTYFIKDELKRAGFKWDAGYDLWYVPMTKKWSWADNMEKAYNYVGKAVRAAS